MRRKWTKKKTAILAASYLTAALLALGFWAWTGHSRLADYRLAAKYSSGRAFDETVRSVEALSQALAKSVYAADAGMCGRICSEAYANALAAETALSTLPFSTQELEQISAFLNVAGDYAYTLGYESAREGFSQEQLENLTELSASAAEFSDLLRQLQAGVGEGSVVMDSREVRLNNVDGQPEGTELLSARLAAYEQSFRAPAELKYDGLYGKEEQTSQWKYEKGELKQLAADCAGVKPEELTLKYSYEGEEGLVCYAAGDTLICVSPAGVVSMSQSRLVGESLLDPDQALEAAETFLAEQGFEDLELKDSRVSGALALLHFARVEDGAVCLDNCVSVTVALDDGSIYAFNAADYDPKASGAQWTLSQEQAEEKLPASLTLNESRKVLICSEGGRSFACYELRCSDGEKQVLLYIDAADGSQRRIEVPEPAGET